MTNPPAQPQADSAYPRRWKALAVLVVSIVVVVLDNTVLNVALPTIGRDLDATQDELIWSINSYSLVFAALLFTWGVLGDRYGRKRVLVLGLVLFGLASALSAFAQSPEQLIAARALMGIGGASVLPVTLAIITVMFPPQERGKAIGAWAAAVGGAVALGPILAGFLLEHPEWFSWLIGNDWGSVFLINVPIIIIGLIGILRVVPESRNPNPGRLDPIGLVLSFVGMLALVYGIQEAGWDVPRTYLWIGAGVLVIIGFLVFEAKTDHPSLDLSLFQMRSFSVPLAGVSLAFAALSGTLLFLGFYYQLVRGWTPLQAGALTLAFAAGQIVAAPRSAKIVARFGARRVIPAGLVLACISMLMIATLPQEAPVWYLLTLGVLFGLGLGSVMAPATTRMTLATPPARSGAGSAVQNTVRQIAAVLGVAALSSIEASFYTSRFNELLANAPLPAQVKAAAADSIGSTYALAGTLQEQGALTAAQADAIRAAGTEAFMPALHAVAYISLGMLLLALVLFVIWLPAQAEAVSWSAGGTGHAPAVPGGRKEADGEADARHQAHLVTEDPEHLSHVDDAPFELSAEAPGDGR